MLSAYDLAANAIQLTTVLIGWTVACLRCVKHAETCNVVLEEMQERAVILAALLVWRTIANTVECSKRQKQPTFDARSFMSAMYYIDRLKFLT